jgi:hypothetical protein
MLKTVIAEASCNTRATNIACEAEFAIATDLSRSLELRIVDDAVFFAMALHTVQEVQKSTLKFCKLSRI